MGLLSNLLSSIVSVTKGNNTITWYCDGCNSVLNEQPGFSVDTGTWTCTESGYDNDVSSDNVFESEEAYQEAMGIPRCPFCGGMVRGDAPDAHFWFICKPCGARYCLVDGELISPAEWGRRKRNDRPCSMCGSSLSGGELTLPWEDGNNAHAYVRCPTCGYNNIRYGFGEDDD